MSRLIQLADGDWIDPALIIGVEARAGFLPQPPGQPQPPSGARAKPAVLILLDGGGVKRLECGTVEIARTERDRIAGVVNSSPRNGAERERS